MRCGPTCRLARETDSRLVAAPRRSADGYGTRFGLLHVDYATQKRTPKLSAALYREVAARNRVV
jgi:Glycosyl hydrolase family 1